MQEVTGPIQFAGLTLDPVRGTLTRNDTPVEIRAKTYALLTHLAMQAGAVMSKESLMAAVWPGRFVSDDTLSQTVKDLRRALGPEARHHVRTFPRRGYMLDIARTDAVVSPSPGAGGHELRLAVLPFEVDGDEVDARIFRDLAEEVTYGLARYRTLTVISPHSSLAVPPDGWHALRADYLVRGRVRRIGERFRMSVDLTETRGGRRLWGESFMLGAAEILSLDEALPRSIIQHVASNAEESVLDVPLSGRPTDLQAFRHFVAARRLLRDTGPGVNEAARDHLNKAMEIDPDFALALAYLALAEIIIGGFGAAPLDVLDRALGYASRAVMLAPAESRCHRMLGLAHQYRRECEAAEHHVRRALEFNPYDTDAIVQLGSVLSNRGRGEEAVAHCRRAIELNPCHPDWYFCDLSIAAFVAGKYDLAAESLMKLPLAFPMRATRIAAALALAGRDGEAARYIDRALAMDPAWNPLQDAVLCLEYTDPEDTARFVEGVRRAMAARPGAVTL